MSRILLILICFAVITSSYFNEGAKPSKRARISTDKQKELQNFVFSLPYPSKILQWIWWFFRGLLGFLCFVLSTIIVTVSQLLTGILLTFQRIIRLVEMIGYSVRVVLQANYSFVLSSLKAVHQFGTWCVDFIRSLLFSSVETVLSLVRYICSLLHSCVIGIPKLFDVAEQAGMISVKAAQAAVKESYNGCKEVAAIPATAAWDILSVIWAVIQLIISTIANSLYLLFELFKAVFHTLGSVCVAVARSVWQCLVNIYLNISLLLDWLGSGMHRLMTEVFQTAKALLYGMYWGLTTALEMVYTATYSLVCYIWSSVTNIITVTTASARYIAYGIISGFCNVIKSIHALWQYLIQITPGGKYSLISITSAGFILFSTWHVYGLNVFLLLFETLESAIQNLVSFINQQRHSLTNESTNEQFPLNNEERPFTLDKKPSTSGNQENVNKLREELERERDKTLCVVCADQRKQILIMPCRHMCLCSTCAESLIGQWNRRVCPLCRCRIRSIIEVYS